MRKVRSRLMALVIALSLMISAMTVFISAEQSGSTGEASADEVYYNRSYGDGWTYSNGFVDKLDGNTARIIKQNFVDGAANYLVEITKENTKGGYLALTTDGLISNQGTLCLELTLTIDSNADFGTVVSAVFGSGLAGKKIQRLVDVLDGRVYVLDRQLAVAEGGVYRLAMELDLDYHTTLQDARGNEYECAVVANDESFVIPMQAGVGGIDLRQIRIGFEEGFAASVGDGYLLDDLKLYSAEGITELDGEDYGILVDVAAPKNELAVKDTLSGTPDNNPDFVRAENEQTVVYNRDFDEGWGIGNGIGVVIANGNNMDLEKEKVDGKYNYFFKLQALNSANSYSTLTVKSPNTGKVVIEFDVKASIGCNVGQAIMLMSDPSSSGAGKNIYVIGFDNGELSLMGQNVGTVGTEWLHVVYVFDMDYEDPDNPSPLDYGVTVYYGDNGVLTTSFNTKTEDQGIGCLRIGFASAPAESYGGWYGLDNLKVYYGDGPAVIADDNYGSLVDSSKPKDFVVDSGDQGDQGGSSSPVVGLVSGSPNLDRTPSDETAYVSYNRTFEEGWNGFNGMTNGLKNNTLTVEYESSGLGKTNYYLQYQANNTDNGYTQLTPQAGLGTSGKMYFEFDIKATEDCNLGELIMIMTSGSSGSRSSKYLVGFKDGELTVFGSKVGPVDSGWVHLAYEIDFDYAKNTEGAKANQYSITCYYGNTGVATVILEAGSAGFGISGIRIGFKQAPKEAVGQWYALDNLQLYSSSKGFLTLPKDNYGTSVDSRLPLDFIVSDDASTLTFDRYVEDSLFLKNGSDYMLIGGERTPIYGDGWQSAYGAPLLVDGVHMIPIAAVLEYLGYPTVVSSDGLSYDIPTGNSAIRITIGRDVALVNNTRVELTCAPAVVNEDGREYAVMAAADLDKLLEDYVIEIDLMYMITVTPHAGYLDLDGITTRLDIMKEFLFNYASEEQMYEMAMENTDELDHPYIFVNQDRFDELRALYEIPEGEEGYDATFVKYANRSINNANSMIKKYSLLDEEGNYLGLDSENVPVQPYPESNGYDPDGGRLSVPTGNLVQAALAYQLTGNLDYVRFVYDYIIILGQWEHWGPGHFLNCADATAPTATAFDWTYDGMIELGLDITAIADVIYSHGVLQGLLYIRGTPDIFGRLQGVGANYTTMANNWNAVCAAGMTNGAMALLEFDQYRAECLEVASYSFESLCRVGMSYYAPDGSYEESPGYWAYGANNVFSLSAILASTLGTDLGLMDCWGLDRTCYFACHIESSDYKAFSYNDGSTGSVDSSWFFFVANTFDDPQLSAIRHIHIANGKSPTVEDVIFYTPVSDEGVELDLQYTFEGIHGMTVRDSWEKGALFAGMLAGDNADGHGQVDCGTWVYHNKGIIWFEDLGSDNYNVYNYFGNDLYYRKNTEGNNCLSLVSAPDLLPHGQVATAVGTLLDSGSNEHGAYFISDNTATYGGLVEYAYRGMFFTNDRKTVVIQDEVSSVSIQSYYWFAHYYLSTVGSPEISEDKRSAIFTTIKNDETYTLRATIVSPVKAFRFAVMDCYTYCLENTVRPGWSESKGAVSEYSRDDINRLVIKGDNVLSVKLAVVIELIDPETPIDVGYTWTEMSKWSPYADTRAVADKVDEAKIRDTANFGNLRSLGLKLDAQLERGAAELFDARYSDLYRSVTDMQYIVNEYPEGEFGTDKNESYYRGYDKYYKLLTDYIDEANRRGDKARSIAVGMIGL